MIRLCACGCQQPVLTTDTRTQHLPGHYYGTSAHKANAAKGGRNGTGAAKRRVRRTAA